MDVIEKFSYHESLIALTTVVALADGQDHESEVDTRVQMVLHEGIATYTIDQFKGKFRQLTKEETFELAISSLVSEPLHKKARACAWMWVVANVSRIKGQHVDLSRIETETTWHNDTKMVQLDELKWINRAKKELDVPLDKFKEEFAKLPEAKRIY